MDTAKTERVLALLCVQEQNFDIAGLRNFPAHLRRGTGHSEDIKSLFLYNASEPAVGHLLHDGISFAQTMSPNDFSRLLIDPDHTMDMLARLMEPERVNAYGSSLSLLSRDLLSPHEKRSEIVLQQATSCRAWVSGAWSRLALQVSPCIH
jgi:hypothetical protein